MNQDNQFPRFGQQGSQQYGYSSYDMPPPGKKGLVEKMFGPGVADKVSSPLFATGALLLAGVAFAGIIIAAYPDSDQADIPVVEADTMAYREVPTDPGGMAIPNRDSTVFSAMSEGTPDDTMPVENLLSDNADEEPVDKLAAFARQVEQGIEEDGQAAGGETTSDQAAPGESSTLAAVEPAEGETAPVTLQKIEPKETVTETKIRVVEAKPVDAKALTSAAEAEAEAARPKIVHKAGENPETLDFVRSVLDKKDGEATGTTSTASAVDVATGAASLQPAAGTPANADFTITPGTYYVQVGSVKTLEGAESEWGRIKKTFSEELGEAPHRVQAAELGDKGTFYRIQAGPMSKDSASSICDSIKAQKPGGCLVIQ